MRWSGFLEICKCILWCAYSLRKVQKCIQCIFELVWIFTLWGLLEVLECVHCFFKCLRIVVIKKLLFFVKVFCLFFEVCYQTYFFSMSRGFSNYINFRLCFWTGPYLVPWPSLVRNRVLKLYIRIRISIITFVFLFVKLITFFFLFVKLAFLRLDFLLILFLLLGFLLVLLFAILLVLFLVLCLF